MRTTCSVVLVSLLVLAQSSNGHAFCRGKPLPEVRSWWVLETGFKLRAAGSNVPFDKGSWIITGDLGYMRNLSRRSAIGLTVYAGRDDDGGQLGLRPRYRYWLGRQVALDLSPGILIAGGNHSSDPRFPAFVATASVNVADWCAFTMQYQRIRFHSDESSYAGTLPTKGTQTAMYAGLTVGSYLGLTLPLGVLGLLVASLGGAFSG